jgi:hypothetical protein
MVFLNKIKEWFLSIRRLTAAIFLSILGILVVTTLYGYAVDFYKTKKNQKYEIVQNWNYDLSSMIGINVSAKTKMVNDKLYFSVNLVGYPEYLNVPSNRSGDFIFQFLDADNFVQFEKRVSLSEFSKHVNEKSKPIGLNYQAMDYLDISTYEKFKSINIKWTFDTEAKKQISAPVVANPQGDQTDHCAVGLTRAERLRRLALKGSIRETGSNTYDAGSRSVMFGYDGGVIYCR